MIGTKLAHYEITSHLGSGGMGDVYQANDLKLGRSVAIKLLPEAFARDVERAARFEREARVLASLNHPNIAAIHGIEESSGRKFLVMELVPGETLAERIKRGPIPIDEALPVGKQIAEGLEAAHERGIIHRDLKAANIKITVEGKIKVLDFGLAKVFSPDDADLSLSNSPTMMSGASVPGVILGTAAYMAPEQARGKPIDKRADVWAFGVVLFEMLTGSQAFSGETLTDLLGAIVHQEPDWNKLPPDLPAPIMRVLRRCLVKDPRHRLHDVADARIEIEAALQEPEVVTRVLAARNRAVHPWVAWVVAAIAITTTALSLILRSPPAPIEADPILLSMTSANYVWQPELSPDGRRLAYIGLQQGKQVVWIRQMDELNARVIPGTEDANALFWLPDSQSLGILTRNELRKIALTGAPGPAIANIPGGVFAGAAANDDGVVIYNAGFLRGPLYRTSPNGGGAVLATALDVQRQETAHLWPQFLPDGRHFIYLATSQSPENNGIYVGSLDSSDRVLLLKANVKALFAPPGVILFIRDTALMAQTFDPNSLQLEGEPRPVANPVGTFVAFGIAAMTASSTGIIGYDSDLIPISDNSRLVWFDRLGKQTGTIGNPGSYWMLNLSPDGNNVAVNLRNPSNKNFDIWMGDVTRGTMSPFISEPSGDFDPEWAPDGRIAFSSDRNGPMGIFEESATGVGDPKPIVQSPEPSFASDWSADGHFVLYHQSSKILAISMTDRNSIPVVDSPSIKDEARFSPDGRWVAYDANDSGIFEVYVVSFPVAGRPIQVSTNGGVQPRWRRDGKEMFYLAPDGKMMVLDIRSTSASSIEFGVLKTLFQTSLNPPSPEVGQYDVTDDGQRFIVITPPAEVSRQFNLLINWTSLLKK